MGSYLEWFRSCSRITVTAHPALAVPGRASRRDGLPIGLQLVGRHRGELALLRLAHAINGATGLPTDAAALMPWPTTPPTAAHRAALSRRRAAPVLAARRRASRRPR